MNTTRRSFIEKLALTSGAAFLPWQNLFAGLLLQEAPFKMQPLRRNVGIFTERGGTIAHMITKNGIVVVDTQFPEQANHLINEINKKTDRKIDLLINTHHHGDHTAGNIAFKGIIDKAVAHENSKANQMRVAKERNATDQQLYPDIVYRDKWSGNAGDEVVTLRYFGPAHTNGDSVIHFENANVAHMGDLIFNRRHPFIDRSAGASIKNWITTLEKVRNEYDDETIFIFGHAGDGWKVTGNKEDLAAMENYLSQLLKVVSDAIEEGKDKEAILKMTQIKGAEEWQGDGIQRPLSAAYEEVTEA